MKLFLGYNLYASVTNMLLDIGLLSFDTLLWNCRTIFKRCERSCNNHLVVVISWLVVFCVMGGVA